MGSPSKLRLPNRNVTAGLVLGTALGQLGGLENAPRQQDASGLARNYDAALIFAGLLA
jgi:hypothetical protein